VSDLKFSIVIPYKQRLDNIKLVFASLADQTLPSSQFEVVVGAMEYSPEFVAACREFTDRITITSVLSAEEWNLSRARNLGLPTVSGQVAVFLDADVMLPPDYLKNLYYHYYAHGQNVCVVGQMVGYDGAVDTNVDKIEVLPYSHYRNVLVELDAADRTKLDDRFAPESASAIARFPWAFTRTGLVALPTATLRAHNLIFDEGFRGWGPEDQEWAYRISRTGTPIVFGEGPSIFGMHLPHLRNVTANGEQAWVNNRYYLAKWPRLDLEMALAFGGWLETDRIYPDVEGELEEIATKTGPLGVVKGTVNGRTILVVGAPIDGHSPELTALFDGRTPLEVLPLAGFATPYADDSIDECRILAPMLELSERYRDAIFREADRVARKVVAPTGDDRR
jgi:glycosyltransferase involved in cell wall biosynthesis